MNHAIRDSEGVHMMSNNSLFYYDGQRIMLLYGSKY